MTIGFLIQVLVLLTGTFALGAFTAFYWILKAKNGLVFLWHRDSARLARIRDLTGQLARTIEERDAHACVIDQQRRELARLRIQITDALGARTELAEVHRLPSPTLAASEGAAL